jgi:hypothetical protein
MWNTNYFISVYILLFKLLYIEFYSPGSILHSLVQNVYSSLYAPQPVVQNLVHSVVQNLAQSLVHIPQTSPFWTGEIENEVESETDS